MIRQQSIRFLVVLIFLAQPFLTCVWSQSEPELKRVSSNETFIQILEPDKPQTRTFEGDEGHLYQVYLTAGQVLHIVIDQRSLQVAAVVFSPTNKKIVEVEKPEVGRIGPIPITIKAESTGNYLVKVRAASLTPSSLFGEYEIRLFPQQMDKEVGVKRLAAFRYWIEGREYRSSIHQTNSRGAIHLSNQKYEAAIQLYHSTDDWYLEAQLLSLIGCQYQALGEYAKRNEYYERALSLRRIVKSKTGYASMLRNLSWIYFDNGDTKTAMDFIQRSLTLWREAGLKTHVAIDLYIIGYYYERLNDKQSAIDYLSQSLAAYSEASNLNAQVFIALRIGRHYKSLGDTQKSQSHLDEIPTLIRKAGSNDKQITALLWIGYGYYRSGAVKKAFGLHEDALNLSRAKGDKEAEAKTLSQTGELYFKEGDIQKSIEQNEKALLIWREVDKKKEEALALLRLGNLYSQIGSFDKAIRAYEQSLELRRKLREEVEVLNILNNIGNFYVQADKQEKALEAFNQALALSRSQKSTYWESTTLKNIGYCYEFIGDRQKALEYYNRAIPLARDKISLAEEEDIFNRIIRLYESMADWQKALEYHESQLEIWRKAKDRYGETKALMRIGEFYLSLDLLKQSFDCYKRALKLSQITGRRKEEAKIYQQLAGIYQRLDDKQMVINCLSESRKIWKYTGEKEEEAQTLTSIGRFIQQQSPDEKGYAKALEFFEVALEIYREINSNLEKEKRKGHEASMLATIANVYFSMKDKEKALIYYQQALNFFQEIRDDSSVSSILVTLGSTYHDLFGDHQKALGYYEQALALEQKINDNNYRSNKAITLLSIGKEYYDLGKFEEAKSQIEEAARLIETKRSANIGFRDLFFDWEYTQIYNVYLDVLMRLHKLRPSEGLDVAAFQTNERTRARNLLSLLNEARADVRDGVDAELLKKEQGLKQRLNDKAKEQFELPKGKHNPEQSAVLEREVGALTSQYQLIQTEIKSRSPRYRALAQPQPLSLKEIQSEILDSETVMVEYALGDERSYLWVVTQSGLFSFELPSRRAIEGAASQVRGLMTVYQSRRNEETDLQFKERCDRAEVQYWPEAARLSQMILGPAASLLGNKRLLIVADGILHYVPFGALPIPDGKETRPVNSGSPSANTAVVPLIVEHEIISMPSASAMAVLRKEVTGRKAVPKSIAVIADPVFDRTDERVGGMVLSLPVSNSKGQKRDTLTISREDKSFQLDLPEMPPLTLDSNAIRAMSEIGKTDAGKVISRLVYTRSEAETILTGLPSASSLKALDFDASRSMATNNSLSEYQIVHFATHGLMNNAHPELSGIVLSLVDKQGRQQDGFLRLHDIYNLKLPAELVVLSACNTAVSSEYKGEGLGGLTRGFMYAGAARVVASLWNISDYATAELMKRFYQGMSGEKHLRPAAALREAQLAMWKQKRWQAPYYWAAFVMQGEWK